MPYKDPAKKTAWDLAHRPDKAAARRRETDLRDIWVATQLRVLRASGVEHTDEQWAELKKALKVGFRAIPPDRN